MKFVCGVSSVEDVRALADIGVEEVFCGLQNPMEPSPFLRILNRREMTEANLQNLDVLRQLVSEAGELGVRVYFTLNEIFSRPQYRVFDPLLQALAEIEIDALIISDFGLLLYLHNNYPGQFWIHMGTGALSINPGAIQLYKEYGARRVILSRKIFTHEIISIVKQVENVEFEVFLESNGFCPNFDGLCNYLHNNMFWPRVQCRVSENGFLDLSDGSRLDSKNQGCKLCALWDYVHLGIHNCKIPSRELGGSHAFELVRGYRDLLNAVPSCSKQQFVEVARQIYTRFHQKDCPGASECYFAKDFYLK